MPCEFVLGQRVFSPITSQIHVVTKIRRDPPRKYVAGWGGATVENVFIQVDNQTHADGQPVWQGWGCFHEVQE